MLVRTLSNGSCMGYRFTQGQELDLPEEVVKALGPDVEILALEKPPKDKMVKRSKKKSV